MATTLLLTSACSEPDGAEFGSTERTIDGNRTIRISARPETEQPYRFGIRVEDATTGAIVFEHIDQTVLAISFPYEELFVDVYDVPFLGEDNVVRAIIWPVDPVTGEYLEYAGVHLNTVRVRDLDLPGDYIAKDNYDYYCHHEWSPVISPWPHDESFVENYETANDRCLYLSDEGVQTQQFRVQMTPAAGTPPRDYTYGIYTRLPDGTHANRIKRVAMGGIDDVFTIPVTDDEIRVWITTQQTQPDGSVLWPEQNWDHVGVYDVDSGVPIYEWWGYEYACHYTFSTTVSPLPHPNSFYEGWTTAHQRCVAQ
ncbi:MAG: hypothetical protein AAGF11_47435 [Myxococcota bacterium]